MFERIGFFLEDLSKYYINSHTSNSINLFVEEMSLFGLKKTRYLIISIFLKKIMFIEVYFNHIKRMVLHQMAFLEHIVKRKLD